MRAERPPFERAREFDYRRMPSEVRTELESGRRLCQHPECFRKAVRATRDRGRTRFSCAIHGARNGIDRRRAELDETLGR